MVNGVFVDGQRGSRYGIADEERGQKFVQPIDKQALTKLNEKSTRIARIKPTKGLVTSTRFSARHLSKFYISMFYFFYHYITTLMNRYDNLSPMLRDLASDSPRRCLRCSATLPPMLRGVVSDAPRQVHRANHSHPLSYASRARRGLRSVEGRLLLQERKNKQLFV